MAIRIAVTKDEVVIVGRYPPTKDEQGRQSRRVKVRGNSILKDIELNSLEADEGVDEIFDAYEAAQEIDASWDAGVPSPGKSRKSDVKEIAVALHTETSYRKPRGKK